MQNYYSLITPVNLTIEGNVHHQSILIVPQLANTSDDILTVSGKFKLYWDDFDGQYKEDGGLCGTIHIREGGSWNYEGNFLNSAEQSQIADYLLAEENDDDFDGL